MVTDAFRAGFELGAQVVALEQQDPAAAAALAFATLAPQLTNHPDPAVALLARDWVTRTHPFDD